MLRRAGGTEGVKVKVKIAVPNPTKVDQSQIKQLLLSKDPEVKVGSLNSGYMLRDDLYAGPGNH